MNMRVRDAYAIHANLSSRLINKRCRCANETTLCDGRSPTHSPSTRMRYMTQHEHDASLIDRDLQAPSETISCRRSFGSNAAVCRI